MYKIVLFLFVVSIIACKSKTEEDKDFDALVKTEPYKEITDAIKKNPKEDSLYVLRGMKLLQLKQSALATKDFKKAYELNDNQNNAFYYATSLTEAGKLKEAEQFLNANITKYPENEELRDLLANCFVFQSKYGEALAIYEGILKNTPEDSYSLRRKGSILAQMGKVDEALVAFEKSYAIFPNLELGNEMGSLYAESQNPKTILIANNVIANDSTGKYRSEAMYYKGLYYSNVKNYDEALKNLNLCLSNDINFVNAYLEKAFVLYEQKKYEEGVKTAILGRKIDPKNAEMYYREGRCLEALGKKQDAATAYKDALALDKNLTVAEEALAGLGL